MSEPLEDIFEEVLGCMESYSEREEYRRRWEEAYLAHNKELIAGVKRGYGGPKV